MANKKTVTAVEKRGVLYNASGQLHDIVVQKNGIIRVKPLTRKNTRKRIN